MNYSFTHTWDIIIYMKSYVKENKWKKHTMPSISTEFVARFLLHYTYYRWSSSSPIPRGLYINCMRYPDIVFVLSLLKNFVHWFYYCTANKCIGRISALYLILFQNTINNKDVLIVSWLEKAVSRTMGLKSSCSIRVSYNVQGYNLRSTFLIFLFYSGIVLRKWFMLILILSLLI